MEKRDVECIVAAILTTASVSTSWSNPQQVVNKYGELLHALRLAGGHEEPKEIVSDYLVELAAKLR